MTRDDRRRDTVEAGRAYRARQREARAARRAARLERRPIVDGEDEYLAVVRHDPCPYCGEPSEVLDHISGRDVPAADGWQNLAGACRSCNAGKRDRSPLGHMLARRISVELDEATGRLRAERSRAASL